MSTDPAHYIEKILPYDMAFRAPGRINLIGEHTDYNGGCCLPAAILPSIYLGISPSSVTLVEALNPGIVTGLSEDHDWLRYIKGAIRHLTERFGSIPPFRMAFGGDLPIGAGLSSSTALCCATMSALNALFDLQITKDELTRLSVIAEQDSGVIGGMMDQISIFNGRKDRALMIHCDTWNFEYIPALLPDYRWLVIDTGVQHRLIDSDYNNRSFACQEIAGILKRNQVVHEFISELTHDDLPLIRNLLSDEQYILVRYVIEENQRVQNFINALRSGSVLDCGELLLASHEGLKNEYRVSCPELDSLVDFARHDARCAGARMMGGGFGGSTLHLVDHSDSVSYLNDIQNYYSLQTGRTARAFEASIGDGLTRIK
ncbi:MAG TPA: galactokinase family protein [Saprospiraceae bacterium]|nr:galactokinase family protein [Saprospiraceae bacterium]HNF10855.1 galactokinase family protein [Saprospiraceae bacterium]HNI78924.1 galactokinase family protein [Saprospiraceae bacterium]HNJ53164.1 galactokinase family protein [Saprospiraceae bacterium]HNM53436.1 galactokinase family protein [Saprospiraceae bacterium]